MVSRSSGTTFLKTIKLRTINLFADLAIIVVPLPVFTFLNASLYKTMLPDDLFRLVVCFVNDRELRTTLGYDMARCIVEKIPPLKLRQLWGDTSLDKSLRHRSRMGLGRRGSYDVTMFDHAKSIGVELRYQFYGNRHGRMPKFTFIVVTNVEFNESLFVPYYTMTITQCENGVDACERQTVCMDYMGYYDNVERHTSEEICIPHKHQVWDCNFTVNDVPCSNE